MVISAFFYKNELQQFSLDRSPWNLLYKTYQMNNVGVKIRLLLGVSQGNYKII